MGYKCVKTIIKRNNYQQASQIFRQSTKFENLILVPIHEETRDHWTLCSINPILKEVKYYDSFKTSGSTVRKNIIKFIEYWNSNDEHFDANDCRSLSAAAEVGEINQKDAISCGLYVLLYSECLAMKSRIQLQKPIEKLRSQIKFLLVAKTIIQ